VHTINDMQITYDPVKRLKTLEERGIDFEDAVHVFNGDIVELEDTRNPYGECRMLCFGMLNNRRVVVGYVQRGETRHIFSMRKCHEREWNSVWV
jgi:uncharacterized DUF497 family protein